jgi:hypothetical protein
MAVIVARSSARAGRMFIHFSNNKTSEVEDNSEVCLVYLFLVYSLASSLSCLAFSMTLEAM